MSDRAWWAAAIGMMGTAVLIIAAVCVWSVWTSTAFESSCRSADGHIYEYRGTILCLTADGRVIE